MGNYEMPIRSQKNQYQGINAHFHSWLQGPGHWKGFHSVHIGDIAKELKKELLPRGYTADVETSLQISRLGEKDNRPVSDIAIYDNKYRTKPLFRDYTSINDALLLTLPETLGIRDEDEKGFRSIAIYRFDPETTKRSEPIGWIELLSPSNKPGSGSSSEQYQDKRQKLLENKIIFIELDYLHETSPAIAEIANYRYHETGSHPYRITVFIPYPSWQEGAAAIYEFDVNHSIPEVRIPLSGADKLDFDFNIPYQRSYEEMLYGLEQVDYDQFPVNFDRYSVNDQTSIANLMLAVVEASQASKDLEQGIVQPENLPLEQAIEQLKIYDIQLS